MISPRPWKFERRLMDVGDRDRWFNGYTDADGMFHQIEDMDVDEMCSVCAAMNAFHEAGIAYADLPKFVEAVRRTCEAQAYVTLKKPGSDAVSHEAFLRMQVAAACLPENKK